MFSSRRTSALNSPGRKRGIFSHQSQGEAQQIKSIQANCPHWALLSQRAACSAWVRHTGESSQLIFQVKGSNESFWFLSSGSSLLAELADKSPRRLSGPFKVEGHVRNSLQDPLNLAIPVLWRAQHSTFNNMTSIIFLEKIRESKQTPATSLHEKGT